MSECWICLSDNGAPLMKPCACPKVVHAKCLARWQLQKAGTAEELRCRFCESTLPDWRENFGNGGGSVRPTMSVEYRGDVQIIRLSGSTGTLDIERVIKETFNIPDDQSLDLSFECTAPESDDTLRLQGVAAFPAALHCAAATARRREAESESRQSSAGQIVQ